MKAILSLLKTGSVNSFRCCKPGPGVARYLTSGGPNSSDPRNDLNIKLARLIAGLFIAAAGVKVVPFASTALVEHTIKLMRTEQPFLQRAGISRLYYLMYFTPTRKMAIELGAVETLCDLLERGGHFSTQNQHKQLIILERLSGLEGFCDHLNCSTLATILYYLESAQLDGKSNLLVARNYSISRCLYKKMCKCKQEKQSIQKKERL